MPDPLPLVSVITPSFNQGAFIRTTIESVLSQDYPTLEYIVIDGGSTDDTLDVLRSYDNRFTWVSESDRGQSHAINKGFARASGEILAWLNSDDVYLPGAVSQSVAFLQAHPEIDLVYGDAQLIDAEGRIIRPLVASKPFSLTNILTRFSTLAQPSAFFRRRTLEQVGPLNERLHYMMDFDFWLRIGLYGQGRYLPGVRAQMRFHPGSKSMSQETRFWVERRGLLDEIFARPDLPAEALAARREAYAHCELYWGDNLLREGRRAEARSHLWYALRQHPRLRRRLLALALWVDAQFNTPFAALGRRLRDLTVGPPQP